MLEKIKSLILAVKELFQFIINRPILLFFILFGNYTFNFYAGMFNKISVKYPEYGQYFKQLLIYNFPWIFVLSLPMAVLASSSITFSFSNLREKLDFFYKRLLIISFIIVPFYYLHLSFVLPEGNHHASRLMVSVNQGVSFSDTEGRYRGVRELSLKELNNKISESKKELKKYTALLDSTLSLDNTLKNKNVNKRVLKRNKNVMERALRQIKRTNRIMATYRFVFHRNLAIALWIPCLFLLGTFNGLFFRRIKRWYLRIIAILIPAMIIITMIWANMILMEKLSEVYPENAPLYAWVTSIILFSLSCVVVFIIKRFNLLLKE